MDESLEKCHREVGNLHLLLAAAYEEMDFIRDRVDLLAAARTAELGQTVADQTTLIDERDAYIRELEAAVDALREQLRLLEQQHDQLVRDMTAPSRLATSLVRRLRGASRDE
jgi:uncharacterized coiled-coil protein SlyX